MDESTEKLVSELALQRRYLTGARLDEARRSLAARVAKGETIELYDVFVEGGFLTPDQAQDVRHAAEVHRGRADLVAGYEVVGELGRGGMGVVYKARRLGSPEMVALKILPPSLATDEYVARFRREAEIVSRLDDEHIVKCLEFGYDVRRRCHFCALELVEGEDLRRRIERCGRLDEPEAVSIAAEIAEALDHASRHDLVHRDVKPENIMVTPEGKAKLLDLGLARSAGAEAARLTQSGLFIGTPYYASPEQVSGDRRIDVRSDIYSLGATLYHMVTGEPPFEATSVLCLLRKHLTEEPRWPREINPDLSDGLSRIINRMMAKSPADRYQSARELLQALAGLGNRGEPRGGDELARLELVKLEHRGRVLSVACSPDGSIIAAGCDDRRVVLWDARAGRMLRTFEEHGGGVCSVAFSADGRFLAAGCRDRTAVVWELGTGERKWVFDTRRQGVSAVAFSPDGIFLVTGSGGGAVLLWDVQFGLGTRSLRPHTRTVWCAAFARVGWGEGGLVLATASDDGTVCLADVNTGERRRTIEGPEGAVFSVAFSPDGSTLATGHGRREGESWRGSARLWDADTGEEVRAFGEDGSAVRSVAFSPDGSALATGGYGNTAALWDVRTGERTAEFRGHTSWVMSVAMSPCGARLVTGSSDRTARVWLTGLAEGATAKDAEKKEGK